MTQDRAPGPAPQPARYFDDLTEGQRFVTGEWTLGEADGPYGGLIASGFQTMALGFRLFYALGVINEACIGGPGIDAVRFHRPARPGDSVHAVVTVAETRPSRSKPDRGYVRMAYDVRNRRNEPVMSCEIVHILMRRPPAS